MSFISIGAAIGSAASAIASGVGAVAGTIGGTVASGLGALGLGTAAAPSALASGIGTLVGGATTGGAIGSGLGAATSAITGGDVGKGAAMGALTGGATGGIGSFLGSGGGAAGAAADAVGGVKGAGGSFIEQAAQQGLGAVPGATVPVGTTAQGLAASAAPVLNSGGASAAGALGGVGKDLVKMAAPEVLKGGMGMVSTPTYDDSSAREQQNSLLNAIETANEVYKPLGSTGGWGYQGMARGGEIRYANKKGGSVSLRNGDFIIPADVVSAIGNGSTKAGAKYLDHLFNALTAGPAPKAGSLAKRRAQERRKA